ncbi:class Ib ribonucleoside-diphosphate reductase assembly flavoprotein NrdI [Pseudoclavibacter sp. 13-3]|uniref:class Ib ribonucleoside-diphosphate reductase assembly flavoprotein NrdI n=1 Tax=Pseudoclavibacter sp. 13-3 TaxID=2901228 RepID=UPI001E512500|nr:class Ib ribonucleoside-diphosphate reductase assembly flavoprotein NrdI [Pseudoclavibacter sp. 13-3]MCD7100592.1 class Ib ribonucleoside-diphosphate reductase assembly flavoprotein NrdI [Pseudoclavibacter sp. 13-3]
MRETPIYFYSSASGLVRRFAGHLKREVRDLSDHDVRNSVTDGPWVLLTPSYKAGNGDNDTLPKAVLKFLASAQNRRQMVGVIGSGNRNFGEHYQAAARQIAARSGRPMLFEFELSGTQEDVARCREILEELDQQLEERHHRQRA